MASSPELYDCPICLHLLQDPATTACGHSYCLKCINAYWDGFDNQGGPYSCPQCRQVFHPRPDLKRNTLLADVLERHKRSAAQSACAAPGDASAAPRDASAAPGDASAAPGDVQCDACTGIKRKASMFCLVCLVSYCDAHLKPHFEVPPLKKHKLIKASPKIRESICERHDKFLEIYCRTDEHFICLQCAMSDHNGHDTVALSAHVIEIQGKLERNKLETADRVLKAERKKTEIEKAAGSIRDAAWEACDDFERLCAEHVRLYVHSVERKCSEMREKVGEAEKAGVDWTNTRLRQLNREVHELRRREDQLNQLSQIDDPIQFLQGFQALVDLPAAFSSHEAGSLTDFVTAQTDKMKQMCSEEKNKLLSNFEKNTLFAVPNQFDEINSRMYFLTKYTELEVDPNTVAACLRLSDGELSWSDRDQAHPDHPDRFTFYHQVLCKTGLTGSHYWEVEWDGAVVEVAVSYKGIQRKGSGKACCFGHNDLSWKLICSLSGCTFWHNNLHKGQIPPVRSRRLGVDLNYGAGKLRFFSVYPDVDPDAVTLLHQIQTTFTEPLYPGFSVDLGSTLKICKILTILN